MNKIGAADNACELHVAVHFGRQGIYQQRTQTSQNLKERCGCARNGTESRRCNYNRHALHRRVGHAQRGFICIHRRLGFPPIFIFGRHVPVVLALGMTHASVQRVSIIITPARFCAVSRAPASIFEILESLRSSLIYSLSPDIKYALGGIRSALQHVVHARCQRRRFCSCSAIL